jgi:hypothetical protein
MLARWGSAAGGGRGCGRRWALELDAVSSRRSVGLDCQGAGGKLHRRRKRLGVYQLATRRPRRRLPLRGCWNDHMYSNRCSGVGGQIQRLFLAKSDFTTPLGRLSSPLNYTRFTLRR